MNPNQGLTPLIESKVAKTNHKIPLRGNAAILEIINKILIIY